MDSTSRKAVGVAHLSYPWFLLLALKPKLPRTGERSGQIELPVPGSGGRFLFIFQANQRGQARRSQTADGLAE